jgi:hypothetical protein
LLLLLLDVEDNDGELDDDDDVGDTKSEDGSEDAMVAK